MDPVVENGIAEGIGDNSLFFLIKSAVINNLEYGKTNNAIFH